MAGTFNTTYAYKQFTKALNKGEKDIGVIAEKALAKMGAEVTKKVKEYVMNLFYSSVPSSTAYHRLMNAGGFLDTISYRIEKEGGSDIAHLVIFCDWTKLYFGTDPGYMPHHMNAKTGEHFTAGLYDYIMNGEWPGGRVSKPQHTVMSGGISEELSRSINDWLGNFATRKVYENLKRAGYDVTIISTVLRNG